MKSFQCQVCTQLVFFENSRCLRCQSALGYLPEYQEMSALEVLEEGLYQACLPAANRRLYRHCRNALDWGICNWMVPAEGDSEFCVACELNQTIPDLSVPIHMEYWSTLEQGKRRLVYSLQRLGLPVVSKQRDKARGLAFEFLREDLSGPLSEEDERVMTGHKDGLITVNVTEADDLERERIRLNLNEVYRSVLGHFRHESGHYYWQRLVNGTTWLDGYRALFGDERANYGKAIKKYYSQAPPPDWPDSFISAYASSHPWEDWAESWAHYLTIVDALETASSFGVSISPNHVQQLFPPVDSYNANTFDEMLDQWLPLTYAVNSINRSGGQKDLYPFVLSGLSIRKLDFIHNLIKST